jgi:hypothetical protein
VPLGDALPVQARWARIYGADELILQRGLRARTEFTKPTNRFYDADESVMIGRHDPSPHRDGPALTV